MTMRILTSKRTPSTKEMAETLNREFSDQYSFKLFGLGQKKSIIVRKSTFVGVQISKYKNEISVDGSFPSITTSLFYSLLFFDGLYFLINLIFGSQYEDLEKEICVFLKQKYS